MKRIVAVIAVTAVVLVVGGVAFAQIGGGRGPGSGCAYGAGYNGANGNINIESLKKFQKETQAQRDDLMIKRAELANEYAKATPDTTKIADLRKQMTDLQAKIQQAAEKNGLPAMRQGRGQGRMGSGMMMGAGQNGCPR